jgi:hypothetical protein
MRARRISVWLGEGSPRGALPQYGVQQKIRGPTKYVVQQKRRPRGVARAMIQLVVIEVTRISEHRLPVRGFEV